MIDWIVAERIARWVAGSDGASGDSIREVELGPLAEEAERRVVAYTGLRPTEPLPAPEGIGRREWIASNIRTTRALLEPVMAKAGQGLGPLRPALQIGMGALASAEVGVLVGYLAQRVLGQYEIVLLDEALAPHPPRLLFVLPNLGHAVERFAADEQEFVTWVTLHEVTHAVQFGGVPWLQSHLAGLVSEILRTAEVRIDRTSARSRSGFGLRSLPSLPSLPNRAELRRVVRAVRTGDLIGVVMNESERATIDRVQAVMALIEGHAEHVMDATAPDLIPSLPKLRHALDSRRRNQGRVSRLVGRLLGLELKLRQYERGKVFCDAIFAGGGAEALRYVWTSPETLPTLAEIEAPNAWLERTAEARAAITSGV